MNMEEFVIQTDTKENIIYLGESDAHKGLNRAGLFIKNEDTHWIREDIRLQRTLMELLNQLDGFD